MFFFLFVLFSFTIKEDKKVQDAIVEYYISVDVEYKGKPTLELARAIERYGRKHDLVGNKEYLFKEYQLHRLQNGLFSSILIDVINVDKINCALSELRAKKERILPPSSWLNILPSEKECQKKTNKH